MVGVGVLPNACRRCGMAGRPICASLVMACRCAGPGESGVASSTVSHFFTRNWSRSFIMIGTMHELYRSFAYLYHFWQPAGHNPLLGCEMRHTHDIRLIHQADTTVFQVQLGEPFLGEVEIVVETLMARGQWIAHHTFDERAIHERHLTV